MRRVLTVCLSACTASTHAVDGGLPAITPPERPASAFGPSVRAPRPGYLAAGGAAFSSLALAAPHESQLALSWAFFEPQ